MPFDLEILSSSLLDSYKNETDEKVLSGYQNLNESDLTIDNFSFYTSVSAVFSSKIEGDEIELDSYIKYKRFGVEFLPDYTRKIDDLYDAYSFAKSNPCDEINIRNTHKLLTRHLLPEHRQGKYRTNNMYVTTREGKIEYVAALPSNIENELFKFFKDLEILLNSQLSTYEIFYFASLLHLVFVKIHPFDDGNGRISRLIEKWFLSEKLGANAWFIQSEKYYYSHHQTYYDNIRLLGMEYDSLDYQKSMPFLLMLPKSIDMKD